MKSKYRLSPPRLALFLTVGLWLGWPACVWPQSITATLPVSRIVAAIAVNEATNKIYVVDRGVYACSLGHCGWVHGHSGSVTVLDGATKVAITVIDPNAQGVCSLAVNPSTNRIYVGNCGSNNVSVIDGGANSVITTVSDPNAKTFHPVDIAVNPTTNKIYIVNNNGKGSGNVTVIDGATNSTVTVIDPNAAGPNGIAVNTLTNRIYVTNGGTCTEPTNNHGNVTVIDGDTNSTTTVTDPSVCSPQAVAVNRTTNTIYVANANDPTLSNRGMVTVIDGATNIPTTVADPNGRDAVALTVDEVTNTVYVANQGYCDDLTSCGPGAYPGGAYSGSISVISGNTKTVTTLIDPLAFGPFAVAVDAVTNQIYVANVISANVTVIDGSGTPTAHALATVLAGNGSGTVTSSPVGIDCGPTCADTYTIGTAVKLVAAAAPGSFFMGWSGPCMGTGSCDLVASQDQFVTANFSAAAAVPNVVGLTQAAASSAITGAGLGVGKVTHQSSGTLASGQVMSESPSAGSNAAPGSMVDLVVSSGAPSAGGSSGGGGGIDLLTLGSLLSCAFFAVRRMVVLR